MCYYRKIHRFFKNHKKNLRIIGGEKMQVHTEINDDIKFLAKSEIRLKILSELNEHPNDIRGLVEKTKITYSSVSSNITKLEAHNYVRKVEKKYYLNPMTEIYFKTLMDFKKSIEIIRNYNSFWDKHNINQLSLNAVKSISDLKNAHLIETTPIDIYKTHNATKKQLIEASNVKAVFPYLHPEYPGIIEEILNNEGSVELIIPRSIFKATITPIDETLRKRAIKEKRLKFYTVKNSLNLYLTVCDEKMSLGLFKNDGSFDQNRILISNDRKAYEWADDLFKHVKDMVKQ